MSAFKVREKLEKDLQKQVLNHLNKHYPEGYWRKLSDKTRSHLPDIIGVYKGKSIAIELKRKGEALRPGQAAELLEFDLAGGFSLYSDNFEKVKDWLRWTL